MFSIVTCSGSGCLITLRAPQEFSLSSKGRTLTATLTKSSFDSIIIEEKEEEIHHVTEESKSFFGILNSLKRNGHFRTLCVGFERCVLCVCSVLCVFIYYWGVIYFLEEEDDEEDEKMMMMIL